MAMMSSSSDQVVDAEFKESTSSASSSSSKPNIVGKAERREFKAETKKLLDIVARSLYSEREVFVRELISNASDSLEKLRHKKVAGERVADEHLPEEIIIECDEAARTLTIEDRGVGMTADELTSNLGTIAHSGTGEFLKQLADGGAPSGQLIGQFGVGFYSAFIVSDKVEVFTRSANGADADADADDAARGHVWTSDGSGTYELAECEGLTRGTRIVLHLKEDAAEFAKSKRLTDVIKRYSNFVAFPIRIDGSTANTVQALWTRSRNEISEAEHKEFYQFVANAYDEPRYTLHFSADSPLHIQSLLYVPDKHTEKYGMAQMQPGVSLYCRRVLIQAQCEGILPDWLRFVKGVVDSEDIPLNLSRELLQDSAVVAKINAVLTRRLLKHLAEQARAEPEQFNEFSVEFGRFFKEGLVTDSRYKEELGKLLRFETSAMPAGQLTSFDDYIERIKASNQQSIYYLTMPSRALCEASPYYEAFKARDIEVVFFYTSLDDFAMSNLRSYDGKDIETIESAEPPAKSDADKESDAAAAKDADGNAKDSDADVSEGFGSWLQDTLDERVSSVKASTRLVSSPAVIIDHESASFRRMMKFADSNFHQRMPKQALEYNPSHPLIRKLDLARQDEKYTSVAELVAEQIFDGALILAGLAEDPRDIVPRLNRVLEHALPIDLTQSSSSEKSAQSSDSSDDDK
jgi:TNF receptor-associated protein 1